MKYSIIKVVNGAFTVQVETSSLQQAKVNFHDLCKTLWNAPDVTDAYVAIMDEQLDVVESYKEYIHHDAPVEPTPESEE